MTILMMISLKCYTASTMPIPILYDDKKGIGGVRPSSTNSAQLGTQVYPNSGAPSARAAVCRQLLAQALASEQTVNNPLLGIQVTQASDCPQKSDRV